jgi:hypothetical protein
MPNHNPLHMRHQPRSVVKALGWTIVSLAASSLVYLVTRVHFGGIFLQLPLLLIVCIGAKNAYIALRGEDDFQVQAAVFSIVLAVLPLTLSVSRSTGDARPPAGPAATTTSDPSATTASTSATRPPTTADPSTTTASTSTTSGTVPATETSQIRSKVEPADMCLNAPSSASDTRVKILTCGGTVGMTWRLPPSGSGQIQGRGDNCLTVDGPYENGTEVTMEPCDETGDHQTWVQSGYEIQTMNGLCLDVDAAGPDRERGPDSLVQIWDCGDVEGHEQEWIVEPQ